MDITPLRQALSNEVSILQKLDHQNIIKLEHYNLDGDFLYFLNGKQKQLVYYIVIEYAQNGDLFESLYLSESGFSVEMARFYFHQLIDTLDYLHNSKEIIHRDLKIENLLLSQDYSLKLADFGLSTHKQGRYGHNLLYSRVGTANCMAPEMLERRPYKGTYSDIFAAGIILFTMVTGGVPF